jgi:nickel-dependent lactate racemase
MIQLNVSTLELPFGRTRASVQIPASNLLGIFSPQESTEAFDETALVHKALTRPIGTPRLRDLARPGQKVAIVTSDLTRPCPSERLLPPVLDELSAAGVPDEDILTIIALGLHRPMTTSELESAVGVDACRRVRVVNHDPADTVRLGVTSAGTPVELFRPLVEADLRVCLGNLEFHYFAGYSGGAKAILPGCASETTVRANHAMMVQPEAAAGRLDGNPVRADIEEGAGLLGVDFILNVLVDGNHRIAGAVAGEVTAAHRRGCEMVAQHGAIPVPGLADIVLVSAGGYPKDVNLYQAQKALDNAAHAVRQGGIIVLVAECREGYGNQTFETWMSEARSPDALLDRIQQEFVLGGHKAGAVAAVLKRAKVYLVSTLPADSVQRCGLLPFDDVVKAMEAALGRAGPGASIIVLPQGGSILPTTIDTSRGCAGIVL